MNMSHNLVEQARSKRFKLNVLLPDAQNRPLRKWKVDQIARNFDFGKWTPPVVRENGRDPILIEGHHRVAAACKRGLGDLEVVCYTHPPIEDDAQVGHMYMGINDQLASTPTQKFLMRLRAEDKVALEVAAIIDSCGYTGISDKAGDNLMHAPNVCEWIYRGGLFRRKLKGQPTPDALVFALNAMRSIYGSDRDAIRPELIRGFGTFIQRWPEADRKAFTRRVALKHPRVADLRADAAKMADAFKCSGAQGMAMVLRQDYNHQAKKPLGTW